MFGDFKKYYLNFLSKNDSIVGLSKIFYRYRSWVRSSIPEEIINWLTDTGTCNLIIRIDERPSELSLWQISQKSGLLCLMENTAVDLISEDFLSAEIKSYGLDRATTKIILELDKKNFFCRDFTIPISAKSHIDQIVSSEIERKTPFKLSDIFFTHQINKKFIDDKKISIQQFIIRKDLLHQILGANKLKITDIDSIRFLNRSNVVDYAPEIILSKKSPYSKKFRLIINSMVISLAISIVISLIFLYFKQENASSELIDMTASISARAAKVRVMADQASSESRLLLAVREERKSRRLLVDILAEITKILPDGSFISELRISDSLPDKQIINISGFSESALKLPALFDKSQIFTEASLTAPIMTDPNEKKDSFSLQVKVKAIKDR
jgi:general secretion pathway protein L